MHSVLAKRQLTTADAFKSIQADSLAWFIYRPLRGLSH